MKLFLAFYLYISINSQIVFLFQVDGGDHLTLFQIIVAFFEKYDVPFKSKIVGFVSDEANVMFGERNSIMAKFRELISTIFALKCVCHSLALAVSYACKGMPPELESMLTDILQLFAVQQQEATGSRKTAITVEYTTTQDWHSVSNIIN